MIEIVKDKKSREHELGTWSGGPSDGGCGIGPYITTVASRARPPQPQGHSSAFLTFSCLVWRAQCFIVMTRVDISACAGLKGFAAPYNLLFVINFQEGCAATTGGRFSLLCFGEPLLFSNPSHH